MSCYFPFGFFIKFFCSFLKDFISSEESSWQMCVTLYAIHDAAGSSSFATFLVECIQTHPEHLSHTAYKRYSEFEKLRTQLEKAGLGADVPRLPQKTWFRRLNESFLIRRRRELNTWATHLSSTKRFTGSRRRQLAAIIRQWLALPV